MAILLNSKQRLDLKTIQSWACCFEPERRFWAEIKAEQLEALWIEYLKQANLYSDELGIEISEELSGGLDIGLPLARKICNALKVSE